MKNWHNFVWQLMFAVLVVFFGGWMVGGVLNFAALTNPQMVSTIFCPAGSSAVIASSLENTNSNGSVISCRDQNGAAVPTLAEDESMALQRKYFYLPSYLLMIVLMIGWFIWSSRRASLVLRTGNNSCVNI